MCRSNVSPTNWAGCCGAFHGEHRRRNAADESCGQEKSHTRHNRPHTNMAVFYYEVDGRPRHFVRVATITLFWESGTDDRLTKRMLELERDCLVMRRSSAKTPAGIRLISFTLRQIAEKCCSTRAPSLVNTVPSRRRWKSGPRNSVSSVLIARVSEGCATPQRRAARVKLRSSYKARKYRTCAISLSAPGPTVARCWSSVCSLGNRRPFILDHRFLGPEGSSCRPADAAHRGKSLLLAL